MQWILCLFLGKACLVRRSVLSSTVYSSWNVQYARNNTTGSSIIGHYILVTNRVYKQPWTGALGQPG